MSKKKGAPARKHRRGGWGALRNRHICSPTQDLNITACPSKTLISGIDGIDGIQNVSKNFPVCCSSNESEFSSYDGTAVDSEVPGESADLHLGTSGNAVIVPDFSRLFSRHCEQVLKLWAHARCNYEFSPVFNHINGFSQEFFQVFDTFQDYKDINLGYILSKCITEVSDAGLRHRKMVLDSNVAYNTLVNNTFMDSHILSALNVVYIYSSSAFKSPLGTVLHICLDNCGANKPSGNYMCLGMGFLSTSRITRPNNNYMCRGMGFYDNSRMSTPHCNYMCTGLGLFGRFYGIKCLLGIHLPPITACGCDDVYIVSGEEVYDTVAYKTDPKCVTLEGFDGKNCLHTYKNLAHLSDAISDSNRAARGFKGSSVNKFGPFRVFPALFEHTRLSDVSDVSHTRVLASRQFYSECTNCPNMACVGAAHVPLRQHLWSWWFGCPGPPIFGSNFKDKQCARAAQL